MGTAPTPGRPLDRGRDAAIIDATLGLFAEVGYDGLTLREVARRAQVSLSTIYRRWPGKSEMVAAALATTLPSSNAASSAGDTRSHTEAHRHVLEEIRQNLTGDRAAYYPSLIAAMRSDPALAAAIRTATIDPERATMRAVVARRLGAGIDTGNIDTGSIDADIDARIDPETIDLIADLGPALLVYRTIVLGESPSAEVGGRIAALVELLTDLQARQSPDPNTA